jgi:hypothetical protein
MMGMMALVRVVPSELYDKIMALKARGESQPPQEPEHHADHTQG